MTIPLEHINIIIPIEKLRKCQALGDVGQFLREMCQPGSGCWHDDELYREGAMNPMEIEFRIDYWKSVGLRPTKKYVGQLEWHDLCVVDSFSGPTLPCRWLNYDPENRVVCSKGKRTG